MLVFSHDEVVHGKATMLGKMPGDRAQQFANLRLSYGFMMTHPGKKLLFMGQDLGEFDEWNENRTVQWELRKVEEHEGIARMVSDLNHLYRTRPELSVLDDSPEGFEWINHVSARDCYLTYVRKGKEQEEILLVVANFAGIPQEITTGVPFEGKYKEIFNTDDARYGGTNEVNTRIKKTKPKEYDDRRQSVTVKLAPLSLSILEFVPFTEEELEKEIERRIRENVPVKKAGKNEKNGKKPEAAKKIKSLKRKPSGIEGKPAEETSSGIEGKPAQGKAAESKGTAAEKADNAKEKTVGEKSSAVEEESSAAKTSGTSKKAAGKKQGAGRKKSTA